MELLPSAILFGGLHGSLIFAGVDPAAVAILVMATTLLGLLTAWARARTSSLYPAIAAHIAFNVGGMFGGIIYAIGYRIFTGELPVPPS